MNSLGSRRFVVQFLLLGLLAILGRPEVALAAKWTVATILVGEYADMEKRVRSTGASDDANVILLHYKAEGSAVAYRLLKDTNASHPPGQCCPNDEPTCCGIEEIPLSAIGIDSAVSASAVKKFYQYVVQHYPADHYLMGVRGDPDDAGVLVGDFTQGITLMELGDALKAVVDARGGKKVEVLVLGFCTSGALDWAYGLAPYVDYFVGSPNFTNPPVATRWRIYRWARDVIEDPSISSRKLASRVVDHFALTTTDCVQNNAGCSNAPKEPWTCVAVETAKLAAVSSAVKDAVCAVLPVATSALHKSVLAASTLYCSTNTPRYDMASYFRNLKDKVSDATAKAAIDRVLAAHDASIVNFKYEAGYYAEKAYGYSFFTSKNLSPVSDIGPWQIDSLWQAYIAKVNGSANPLPALTGLVADPPDLTEAVGGQAPVIARGVSAKFPSMCAVSSVNWSTDSLNGVAALDQVTANPVVVTGTQPGTGTLKASASGFSASAKVTITSEPSQDGGHSPGPSPRDGGSAPVADGGSSGGEGLRPVIGGCDASGGSLTGVLAATLLALSRRRRRAF